LSKGIAEVEAVLARCEPVRVEADESVRRAAVALVLRESTRSGLELLFIRRAEYPGDPWSGQVAFPGGRHEPGDETLVDTAIRETHEELSLDLRASGRVIGCLDDLHPRTPVLPPIVVRPFVFAVESGVKLAPSAEVADAFWVPVPVLGAPETSAESVVEVRGMKIRVPSFRHGPHVIWGMTERMLRQFMGLLMSA
jgi:8-oxo-dGTP pyrophosphatase MutT (NUDIX family)